MIKIENDLLLVTIAEKGAELKSIIHKQNGLEYMWSGDAAYWDKTSPVLFPIVGTLKENKYYYKDREYSLSRHGFARDQEFAIVDGQEDSVSFTTESNDDTLLVYPFPFELTINYALNGDALNVEYAVQNTGSTSMYFSIGGHPAFKLPFAEGTTYNDYHLVFEKKEAAGRWPITSEGLIKKEPQPFLESTNHLPLAKELFQKDAIVLKHLKSDYLDVRSDKTPHGLRFNIKGFPYLGLWAVPGADFLCIEPWCGIADSEDADQQLVNKEGIIALEAKERWAKKWTVRLF